MSILDNLISDFFWGPFMAFGNLIEDHFWIVFVALMCVGPLLPLAAHRLGRDVGRLMRKAREDEV